MKKSNKEAKETSEPASYVNLRLMAGDLRDIADELEGGAAYLISKSIEAFPEASVTTAKKRIEQLKGSVRRLNLHQDRLKKEDRVREAAADYDSLRGDKKD